jgi:hypothetical protein
VSFLQIVEVTPARLDTLGVYDKELGVVKQFKHFSRMAIMAEVCSAAYAVHTEEIWEGTTLQRGI